MTRKMGVFVRRFQKGTHWRWRQVGERRKALIKRDHKVCEIVTIEKFAALSSGSIAAFLVFQARFREFYPGIDMVIEGLTLIANGNRPVAPNSKIKARDPIRLLLRSRITCRSRSSRVPNPTFARRQEEFALAGTLHLSHVLSSRNFHG